MIKVGVVIVTYNNAEMLKTLLTELINQTVKPNEITVIDNASGDQTQSVAQGFSGGQVRYIRMGSNTGSAGGYYQGIKSALENNDLIWLLDDDVSVKEDALEALLKFPDYIRLGAVRSSAGQFSGSLPVRTKSFAWRGTLIPKEIIQSIGLPRKEYFLYAEDVEYSLRMVKYGYSISWVPQSLVVERRSTDKIRLNIGVIRGIIYQDPFRIYYAHRNQVNLYLEYRDFFNLFKIFAHALKLIFLLVFLQGRTAGRQIKAVFKGISDGIKGDLGRKEEYLP